MNIKSIKIENLFEIFHYDISFHKEDNILLITGPNGFGKTMILNIIFHLFKKPLSFFKKLVFDKITVELDEDVKIVIVKKVVKDKFEIIYSFFETNHKIGKDIEIDKFEYSTKIEIELNRYINRQMPFFHAFGDEWTHYIGNKKLSIDDVLKEHDELFPNDRVAQKFFKLKSNKANRIFQELDVHFIKEQRLFVYDTELDDEDGSQENVIIEAVQSNADELKDFILENIQTSFNQTQALDSTYLDRLIDEKSKISENDYITRLSALNKIQEKLIAFGLYENRQKIRDYSKDDAKALLVYVNDLEQKLLVFNDLLQKLELFTTILNERRFTFKSINISKTKGFYFKTSTGKELELNQLSSGEQHEVVLLYELIFNVKSNVLVLIDEPEISLHVTWQKEFLNDLLKIVKIQNIQVIVATHSPSIINGRWDLVYNLETPRK